jgi:hypothetical protein
MIVVRPVAGLPRALELYTTTYWTYPTPTSNNAKTRRRRRAGGTSVTHLLPTRQEGRDHLFQRVVVAVGPREADAAALRVEEAVVVLHEVRP